MAIRLCEAAVAVVRARDLLRALLLLALLGGHAQADPPPHRLLGAYHGYAWWSYGLYDTGNNVDSVDVVVTDTYTAVRFNGWTLPISSPATAFRRTDWAPCDSAAIFTAHYFGPDTAGQHYPATAYQGSLMVWGYGPWRAGTFAYDYYIDPCAYPASGDTIRGWIDVQDWHPSWHTFQDTLNYLPTQPHPWAPHLSYGYGICRYGECPVVGQWWATRTLIVGPPEPPAVPSPDSTLTGPSLAEHR